LSSRERCESVPVAFAIGRSQRATPLPTRDYLISSVLHNGKDFIIIDFEGAVARPLGRPTLVLPFGNPLESEIPPLRAYDVLPALWCPALRKKTSTPCAVARFWYRALSAAFPQGYLLPRLPLVLPPAPADLGPGWDAYLLDKSIYHIGYDLQHRPEWTQIPRKGLLELSRPERESRTARCAVVTGLRWGRPAPIFIQSPSPFSTGTTCSRLFLRGRGQRAKPLPYRPQPVWAYQRTNLIARAWRGGIQKRFAGACALWRTSAKIQVGLAFKNSSIGPDHLFERQAQASVEARRFTSFSTRSLRNR